MAGIQLSARLPLFRKANPTATSPAYGPPPPLRGHRGLVLLVAPAAHGPCGKGGRLRSACGNETQGGAGGHREGGFRAARALLEPREPFGVRQPHRLSLIHISEPTRLLSIS